eukprot:5384115-Prymnesium_polylepis.1
MLISRVAVVRTMSRQHAEASSDWRVADTASGRRVSSMLMSILRAGGACYACGGLCWLCVGCMLSTGWCGVVRGSRW